jgi:hypothetical protein
VWVVLRFWEVDGIRDVEAAIGEVAVALARQGRPLPRSPGQDPQHVVAG